MKHPITKVQIKLIHTAKSVLNMDEGTYRELLMERYKVSSSKDLTQGQAAELITHLNRLGFKPLPPVRLKKKDDKVIQLATQQQLLLIDVLRANIYWKRGDEGFGMWLDKFYHIDKVRTFDEAYKVIEGLKGMLGINYLIIKQLLLPFPKVIFPGTWVFDVETKKLIKMEVGNDNAG
ncbi:MAG: regulatory protein GemA [Deferribacteraceae bacterium]|jgi:hypothetical protein|nr:regulatory protein GemA [Deferribacteraceae bacterium]